MFTFDEQSQIFVFCHQLEGSSEKTNHIQYAEIDLFYGHPLPASITQNLIF